VLVRVMTGRPASSCLLAHRVVVSECCRHTVFSVLIPGSACASTSVSLDLVVALVIPDLLVVVVPMFPDLLLVARSLLVIMRRPRCCFFLLCVEGRW